jgi:hypothetical protein
VRREAGVVAKQERNKLRSEEERRAVFLALAAQDTGKGVVRSRKEVAERYGITDREVRMDFVER